MNVAPLDETGAREIVARAFNEAGIRVLDLLVSSFPEESVLLVRVAAEDLDKAVSIGNQVDRQLGSRGFSGFVTVRPGEAAAEVRPKPLTKGVLDERAQSLTQLLTTRARASEIQPSLSYVPDVAANVDAVTASRHHLIFGRRGAGKTALMVEGRRLITEAGNLSVWVNVQTHRDDTAAGLFLWIADELCSLLELASRQDVHLENVGVMVGPLKNQIGSLLKGTSGRLRAGRVVPLLQQLLNRFSRTAGRQIFVFLDDFHYLNKRQQAEALDLLHRAVRDTDVWLKVAAIEHLSRWWDAAEHLGLQTGHDADAVRLDVTLQDPTRAERFLEEVLSRYAGHVSVPAIGRLYSRGARDRLVLASGAVPRDYLTLAARSMNRTRMRANPRLVGVQDVNNAAGDAAQVKIDELEEDLASGGRTKDLTLSGLQRVRQFCLEEKAWTYFRIDFKDKESHSQQYEVLSSLLDVRLIHLLEPSLSHPHRAGERSEVYMLDLSQFSGQRLKHFLRVLDLDHGVFISKITRQEGGTAVGNTPRKLNTILRAAPLFQLETLEA